MAHFLQINMDVDLLCAMYVKLYIFMSSIDIIGREAITIQQYSLLVVLP